VGFYVADAVGHGMPAALLTMFIKKAMQTKRIIDHGYELVPPEEVLRQLNVDLCQQNLSACQFCTACYAILDTQTLSLHYARGGHPHPILLRADRSVEHLEAPGPLLGIFPEEQFPARRCQLQRGDRLVMFSDGAEDTLAGPGCDLLHELQSLRSLSAEELVLQLTMLMEERRAADACSDDITMIVLDVEG
jgi:sigma-B regulation protein RsbU (phosphoserine phosphatase)